MTASLVVIASISVSSAEPQAGRTIRGRLLDRVSALPGVTVIARARSNRRDAAVTVVTAADGGFVIEGLAPDEYELRVVPPGSETSVDRLVDVRLSNVATINIEAYRGCDTFEDASGSTTETDLAEVMRVALEQNTLPGGGDRPILSSTNLRPGTLDGTRFRILTPDDIQRRASQRGEVHYLSVDHVRRQGGCIAVGIVYRTAYRPGGPPVVLLGGAGVTREFRRVNGAWKAKQVVFWQH